MEHEEEFSTLTNAKVAAPVLGYLDYSKEFILEMDASLKELGAVLSQQGDDGKSWVIAYASTSLQPF